VFRVRFHAGEAADYTNFARMRDEGMSDVVAMLTRFTGAGAIGEMDSLYSYGGVIVRTALTTRMWGRWPA
jgi:hypothetical protein